MASIGSINFNFVYSFVNKHDKVVQTVEKILFVGAITSVAATCVMSITFVATPLVILGTAAAAIAFTVTALAVKSLRIKAKASMPKVEGNTASVKIAIENLEQYRSDLEQKLLMDDAIADPNFNIVRYVQGNGIASIATAEKALDDMIDFYVECHGLEFRRGVTQNFKISPPYFANVDTEYTEKDKRLFSLIGFKVLLSRGPEILQQIRDNQLFRYENPDYDRSRGLGLMKALTGQVVDLETILSPGRDYMQEAQLLADGHLERFKRFFDERLSRERRQEIEIRPWTQVQKSYTNTDRGRYPIWKRATPGSFGMNYFVNVPNVNEVTKALLVAPFLLAISWLGQKGDKRQFIDDAVSLGCFNAKLATIEERYGELMRPTPEQAAKRRFKCREDELEGAINDTVFFNAFDMIVDFSTDLSDKRVIRKEDLDDAKEAWAKRNVDQLLTESPNAGKMVKFCNGHTRKIERYTRFDRDYLMSVLRRYYEGEFYMSTYAEKFRA